jgi:tetratricopeptide (TPR) repeat protein
MPLAKWSLMILTAVLTLFAARETQARALAENQLSGRLIFERSAPCDRCPVNLMTGAQTVATSYADAAGNFVFENVPPGSYTIHVEVAGYEEIDQQVDVSSFGFQANNIILLSPKARTSDDGAGDSNVVHISEFSDRYPKKAVESFKKGLQEKSKGKNDEAIKYFQEAVKIAPGFYQAHNELGVMYRQVGRREDAEAAFLRAHDLNASTADPLINLTSLYIEENNAERAVDTGEKAVKTNSRSASAFLNLGVALYKAAQLDRAEAALKKALELAPKMLHVRLMLANVYLKQERYDSLLEQLNKYLSENPKGEQRQAVEQMRDQLLTTKAGSRP